MTINAICDFRNVKYSAGVRTAQLTHLYVHAD